MERLFLTGFDSKAIDSQIVDKSLFYHQYIDRPEANGKPRFFVGRDVTADQA